MGLCHSNRSNDDYRQMICIYNSDHNITESYPLPKDHEESDFRGHEYVYWCSRTNQYLLDPQDEMPEGCSMMSLTWKWI